MTLQEIAAHAARLVVEEGQEYGVAKRRAAQELGLDDSHQTLPDNDLLESEVRAYLALFRADTHPAELLALRQLAARWMQRLAEFRPHLSGAAWRGTATSTHDLWIGLFCDDPKAAEIWMLNESIDFDSADIRGFNGKTVPVLSVMDRIPGWKHPVAIHFPLYDHDDIRGALKTDRQGLTDRGPLPALLAMIQSSTEHS